VLVSGYSCAASKRSLEEVEMGEKRSVFNPNGSIAVDQDGSIWSSAKWGQEIPIGKQIFCNRSLNMKNIVAVGFDMDYTLAQYMPETFESLAYNGTIKKLVFDLGYPTEVCAVIWMTFLSSVSNLYSISVYFCFMEGGLFYAYRLHCFTDSVLE